MKNGKGYDTKRSSAPEKKKPILSLLLHFPPQNTKTTTQNLLNFLLKFACDEVCAEIFAKFVHLCLVRCEKKNNLEIPLFLKTTRNLALLFSGVKKKHTIKEKKKKKSYVFIFCLTLSY